MLKLRQELEEAAADIWGAASAERDQIRSVLADLAKTSGDFRLAAAGALASITAALMSRIRCAVPRHDLRTLGKAPWTLWNGVRGGG